jgi:hypothetical protein
MNLFDRDGSRNCHIAEGWVPTNDIPLVQQSLKDAAVSNRMTCIPLDINSFIGCFRNQPWCYCDRVKYQKDTSYIPSHQQVY